MGARGRWLRGGRIALALVSLLVSILIVESALRLFLHGTLVPLAVSSAVGPLRTSHPALGWVGVPGAALWRRRLDYLVHVEMNSRGFRDVEHTIEKPSGLRRFVVLGDSFMEAPQTSLEESFPRLLEAALGPGFEVINLGMSGYGTLQELLLLEQIGLAYKPDVVLLAFFNGNDVRDNSAELERRLWQSPDPIVAARPYAQLDPSTGRLAISPPEIERSSMQAEGPQSFEVVEHTLLGRIAALGGRRLKETWLTWWRGRPQGPDPNIALGWPVLAAPVTTGRRRTPSQREYDELWDHAWRTTARLILAVHDLAERSGARLVLVSVPSRLQVEEGVRDVLRSRWPGLRFDVTRINRALAELAEHNRIDYVDLLPAFEHAVHAGARSPYHTWEDEHWTPAGHRMAAAAVASHLAQAPRFAE